MSSMMTITKDVPITIDREILSGTPVFTGTRVPVSALLENLEAGVSLDEFLENFPTVSHEQAVSVLKYYKSTPLQFGKYASASRPMSSAKDFQIAEWHPVDLD